MENGLTVFLIIVIVWISVGCISHGIVKGCVGHADDDDIIACYFWPIVVVTLVVWYVILGPFRLLFFLSKKITERIIHYKKK